MHSSCSDGYIAENLQQEFSLLVYVMSLLACGSIHQGHERFKGQSRGKQCSFMSLSVLINAQNIPVMEWNTSTIDSVLIRGDTMYLDAFENGDIPHKGFIEQINVLFLN